MKTFKSLTIAISMILTIGAFAQSDHDLKIMDDADTAKMTLIEADETLNDYFETAAGYVLFPNVGEGGFIIGGASGNGVVYENGIAIGMANLKKIDIGFQVGGQAIIEIIFFESEADLAAFKKGNFEFSAEASAVVVESGIAVTSSYDDGVVAFALPKAGLMAGASIGGQKFSYKAF